MAAPDPAQHLFKDSSCTGGGVHTWQHPIPRSICSKILLAPEGASTHGSTRSSAAAVQRFFLHRRGRPHMAAPDPAPQLSKDSSCTGGGVHTWQHPIQRRSCPKILLAPEGASTHALLVGLTTLLAMAG